MNNASAATDSPGQPQAIDHGGLFLDLNGYSVQVQGQDVPVTLTEFLLLKELAGAPYRTFDRRTLAAAVQERGFSHDLQPISARAVDLHISRLRRKLVEAGYDCIRTMRFVGYRFIPLAPI
jgi:two-component system OmpR family response regulator